MPDDLGYISDTTARWLFTEHMKASLKARDGDLRSNVIREAH
jgi:hypothetical protein